MMDEVRHGTLDADTPDDAHGITPTPAPDPAPAPPPTDPDDEPEVSAAATIDERVGSWECLNTADKCGMAAPDPRTPGKLFDGPIQGRLEQPVTCPECHGEKVIYRGEKVAAATA